MENTSSPMDPQGTSMALDDILDALRIFDGEYKRDHVDAAIRMKEAIIPHLIALLDKALSDPDVYTENEDLNDHTYALMLLGHFKEPRAHKVIVDLFSLPGDYPDKLFGDIKTLDLPVILVNTCGGSVELIKSLIINKEIDDYCRIPACEALTYAVLEGYASREEVLDFFGNLFTGNEADEFSDFWSFLALSACALWPDEIQDVIREAYENGFIFDGTFGFDEFEEALAKDRDACLKELREEYVKSSLDDIHSRMAWWACFNETSGSVPTGIMGGLPDLGAHDHSQ